MVQVLVMDVLTTIGSVFAFFSKRHNGLMQSTSDFYRSTVGTRKLGYYFHCLLEVAPKNKSIQPNESAMKPFKFFGVDQGPIGLS